MIRRFSRATLPAALVCAALVIGCGEKTSPVSAPPAPVIPSIAFEGTLHEGFSGAAITEGEAVLSDGFPARILFRAPLDSEGDFRFERVSSPDGSHLALGWLPPDAADAEPVNAMGAPADFGTTVYARLPTAPDDASDIDVGTIAIWLPDRAATLFRAACTERRPKLDALPGKDGFVAFYVWKGEWEVSEYDHREISTAWPKEWKGVLCIDESNERVGSYPEFVLDTAGLDTIWKVRLVRLPEGKVLTRTLRSPPPEKVLESEVEFVDGKRAARTEPLPLLLEWLRELGA